jgi:hypothetical protein
VKFASFALSAVAATVCASGAHATKTLFIDNNVWAYAYDNEEEWLSDLAGREVRLEDFSDADLDPAIIARRNLNPVDGKVDIQLRDQERWIEMHLRGTSALAFNLTESNPDSYPHAALAIGFGPTAGIYTYVTAASGFFGLIASRSITDLYVVDRQGDGPTRVTFDNLRLVDANSVPEPATWAMSIFGFGLIGAVARRRGPRIAFG